VCVLKHTQFTNYSLSGISPQYRGKHISEVVVFSINQS